MTTAGYPLPPLLRRDKRKRPQGRGPRSRSLMTLGCGGILPSCVKRKVIGGDLGHNEFDRYAARGRKQFGSMFPFGEMLPMRLLGHGGILPKGLLRVV